MIFTNVSKSVIVKNFFSLVTVQIANYILPLIVLPYLARTIGAEKFGTVFFAQAIVGYIIMFTLFGFNLYAPKEIAIIKENQDELRNVFWNVMYARFLLGFIAFCFYIFLILKIPKFREELWLFIFTFGLVVGNILSPFWFFQGIEKMVYIAIINFLIKLLYTLSIFFWIKEKSDYIFIPLLQTLSQVAVGITFLIFIIFSFKLFPIIPEIKKIFLVLKDSLILFVSNISISIYTKIPPVLLGFLAGDIYVGYYTASEKLFSAWMGIQTQLTVVLYPRISRLAKEVNRSMLVEYIRKSLFLVMGLAVPATLLFFILARFFILFLYGKEFLNSVIVLKILSFLFIIIGLSNVFGIQTMLPLGMKKEFSFPILSAGLINLLTGFILIPKFKHLGAALSFLISEIWVVLFMGLLLYLKGIKLFSGFSPKKIVRDIIGEIWKI